MYCLQTRFFTASASRRSGWWGRQKRLARQIQTKRDVVDANVMRWQRKHMTVS